MLASTLLIVALSMLVWRFGKAGAWVLMSGALRYAFVAAGATVIGDVPAHALMVGNPARAIGWVCECGERLGVDLRCACGRAYVNGNLTEGLRPA